MTPRMHSSLLGEVFLSLSACTREPKKRKEKKKFRDALPGDRLKVVNRTDAHPFDSKLLNLVVFPLEKLLHIFENSTGAVQVS